VVQRRGHRCQLEVHLLEASQVCGPRQPLLGQAVPLRVGVEVHGAAQVLGKVEVNGCLTDEVLLVAGYVKKRLDRLRIAALGVNGEDPQSSPVAVGDARIGGAQIEAYRHGSLSFSSV